MSEKLSSHLVKEWNHARNLMDVSTVTSGSHKKVWWICGKGHEWETAIEKRTRGSNCPICSNNKVLAGFNDLATTSPELAKTWHPTLNGELSPKKVSSGSNAKVWWICEKGHEWEAKIANRSLGRNCPICSNKKILTGFNDLETTNSKVAESWHPTKNHNLAPTMVSIKSHKKVWWICDKDHEWEAVVASRSSGSGCPICANKIVLKGFNDLETTDPKLAETWHPTKNDDLLPTMITRSSARKVWWICKKGHEWETILHSRTNSATNCPFCSNRKILKGENDLATTHPDLANEWHPTKNGSLTAGMIAAGSSKKVWWLAACDHEWEATLGHRMRGRNCPVCVSKKVLSGYNDLKTKNPELSSEWHPIKNGELTPDKIMNQSNKNAWWLGHCGHEWKAKISGRAKHGCPICSGRQVLNGYNDIFTTHSWTEHFWDADLNSKEGNPLPNKGSDRQVYWKCFNNHSWKTSVHNLISGSGCPVCSGRETILGYNDIFTTHPWLKEFWDEDLNAKEKNLLPSKGSESKVFWKCTKDHSWKATAYALIAGTRCPVCSGHKCVAGINDLQTTHPELAKEWHPTKNGALTPSNTISGSRYKAWWQCNKGHEWKSRVTSRKYNSTSCPRCWASDRISKPEKEILDFLVGLDLVVEHSNRQLLNNRQEIDFYLPEKQIGIEYNGLYWHSEAAGRSEQYHHAKWSAANKAGFRLIQVWEDDWRDRKQIVMRTIAHNLGVSLKLDGLQRFDTDLGRAFLKTAKAMSLTGNQASNFLNENHVQGFISGSHYLGLVDSEGTIRSVMVLKSEANQIFNILRYADYGVSDGFSKMLAYAELTYAPTSFISTIDNCANDRILHEANNFVIDKEIAPDFMYLYKAVRNHQSEFILDRFRDDATLKWDANLTELELARLNKIHRIWDAGKTRYRKDCKENLQK